MRSAHWIHASLARSGRSKLVYPCGSQIGFLALGSQAETTQNSFIAASRRDSHGNGDQQVHLGAPLSSRDKEASVASSASP